MSITSTVGYDGSARITLDGHEVSVPTVLDDDAHLELGDLTIRIEHAPTAPARRSHHGDSRTD